eukprot:Sro1077_g238690.1 leucine rich repeat (335) ;mRNA; f:33416-34618
MSPTDECDWAFLICNDEVAVEEIIVTSGFVVAKSGVTRYENVMRGTLPMELSLFTSLKKFEIAKNGIQGDLDSAFLGITTLEHLDVHESNLSGTFPNLIIQNKPNLKQLSLAENSNIRGSVWGLIPPALETLDIEGTRVNGSLQDLLSVPNSSSFDANSTDSVLQVLSLSRTEISGTLPSSIARLSNMTALSLAQTNLQGTLPMELLELRRLETLILPMTGLSGSLPSAGIGNWTRMRVLDLSYNQFRGTIPENLHFLNSSLQDLILNDNAFSGELPEAFYHLTALETLRLDGNELTGRIPGAVCAERGTGVQQLATLFVDCVVECGCCDGCRD